MKNKTNIVFVGLGSNRGEKKKNILKSIELLKKYHQKILKISSFYRTEPYGCKNQNTFLNAIVKLKTELSPKEFLFICKNIEKVIGRKKSFRWGPREIDLDILFFGKKVIKSRILTIPHKDLHNREFVLKPLKEISPGLVHPVLRKRISRIKS
ncbi:MAG: 2-amino-4-hydroxy-6-hydroxymethyldihydropteridine diphosphokinase [Elusimicrobia bacterium RIFOXYC2_FULL_34_12]|nr:MAG: 2-amino-4-hydroxy-6-hydroxymethyldihydropteridine diphosphokinase [Elusimicrobia bacterium RIFOXYC2_FULL_34_12]OGS38430.1 MAG: 2-amino-4-hydroxy-6-hydroxymethyldihydropteridine diphosphokinase [Elusimicrobia bacterium RIFOXYD2_FULL_34_30]HAM38184.1 2-amino-4-hydroxy-6-hydroxymethyldihydropteridine diphosphokinase [Elusimicrobiota bacterium]